MQSNCIYTHATCCTSLWVKTLKICLTCLEYMLFVIRQLFFIIIILYISISNRLHGTHVASHFSRWLNVITYLSLLVISKTRTHILSFTHYSYTVLDPYHILTFSRLLGRRSRPHSDSHRTNVGLECE